MKGIWNLVKEIPLSNILLRNSYQEVLEILEDSNKGILSRKVKVYLMSFIGWLISLISAANWVVFPICSTLILAVNLFLYLKSKNFFKNAAYNLAMFINCQTVVIFYIASLEVTDNRSLNRGISTTYILISFLLVFFVAKTKLLETLQVFYVSNKKNTHKLPIKIVKKISIFITIFIVLLVAGMQFYRLNKWWLRGINSDALSGLNGTLFGNIISILAVIIGLTLLMLVTLTPTVLLNSKVVVTGLLLRKYSEEVRFEYDFTEEEWYGEMD